MSKFLDFSHPFYKPAWIRVLIVAICAVWGVLEVSAGELVWGVALLALSAFCAWQFVTIDYTALPDE